MCRRQCLLTQSSWSISGRLTEPRRGAGWSSHDEGVDRGGSHKRRRSSTSCSAWQDNFDAVGALGLWPFACAQVHIDELRGGRVPATAGTSIQQRSFRSFSYGGAAFNSFFFSGRPRRSQLYSFSVSGGGARSFLSGRPAWSHSLFRALPAEERSSSPTAQFPELLLRRSSF